MSIIGTCIGMVSLAGMYVGVFAATIWFMYTHYDDSFSQGI